MRWFIWLQKGELKRHRSFKTSIKIRNKLNTGLILGKKILHNIDTFYYSVKLNEDFTDDSKDAAVLEFRKFFEKKKSLLMANHGDQLPVFSKVFK